MIRHGAGPFGNGLLPAALLALLTGVVLAMPAQADTASTAHPVTATPPLVAIPATSVSKSAQQRMRACNAGADARKLQTAARETYLKSCMSAHRARIPSRAGSEAKPHP